MKTLFIKYKSVLQFILTFLLVYSVLSFGYKYYLSASIGSQFYPDYVTNIVASQTEYLLNSIGYSAQVLMHQQEPSMKLILEGKYIVRIIEGCNGISVIILFVSFVIAFSGKFKITVLFLVLGSVIIYTVNLFRIVLLTLGLYYYPWHGEFLHTVIFPAVIYGIVFLLWMLWVNKFSNLCKKNE